MTANLLTLNTSKTEFLLIGLKQQLAKIQDCTLNTTHSACNLRFTLTNISLSLIKYLHYPKPAILTFVNFAVSAPILISKQPPPLSTLNLTTVTHYTTVKKTSSNPELSCSCSRAVVKASSLTPLLFLNLYTGWKSIKWINVLSIRFFLLHIKFLLLLNLATSEIWSLLTHLLL